MAPLIDESTFIVEPPSSSFDRPESPSSFRNEERQKKSVSFSVMSDLYLIPHANDLKRKEKEATWMNKKDFRKIESENLRTLHDMSKGHFPCTEKQYFRGLEALMPEARRNRKQRINFVVHTILREQQKNRVLNDQWLEALNRSFTSKSAEAAYRKGVWDAAEATRKDASDKKIEVWI